MKFGTSRPPAFDKAGTDYYHVLGVPAAATFAELKRAYYHRAKQCHPDRFGGDPEKEEEFKTLVAAFDVLSDPLRRRSYDRQRRECRAFRDPAPGNPAFVAERAPWSPFAVMDTLADDILEELIVGNTIPVHTTLRTLFLDLENTERFCRFREAKNLFYAGRIRPAHKLLLRCISESPENILYHYFLAQTLKYGNQIPAALSHLDTALALGASRRPPLPLLRIRRERNQLARRRLPFRGAFACTPAIPEDSPSEHMRRRLARCINRLASRRFPDSRPKRLTE